MNRNLYVGNPPFETTETELESLFTGAGTVTSVHVVREREIVRPRGFAFVEMAIDADALNAISSHDDAALGGRNISVNEARPQEPRSDSGGAFGRSRGNRR